MNLQNVSLAEPTEEQLKAFEEWIHYEVNANRRLNMLDMLNAAQARDYLRLAYRFANRFASLQIQTI
jgi:hypothetical protein